MTCISFPEGVTEYSGSLALDGNELSMRGQGSHNTFVVLPGPLVITYTNIQRPPQVEGITFLTRSADAGTCLKIIGPVAPSSVTRGPSLSDVAISGEDWANDWWNDGLHLVDCWYPSISGLCIRGRNLPCPPFAMGTGLKFERTQVLHADDFQIYWAQDGIAQLGSTFGEGLRLSGFEIVGVNRGIVLKQGGGTAIHDGHINAFERGITMSGRAHTSLHDLLIYKTNGSNKLWVGIESIIGEQIHIRDNTLNGDLTATNASYGIVLIVVYDSQIIANNAKEFNSPGALIVVGTACHDNIIANNYARVGCGPVVQVNGDAGVNNYLSGNKP